MQQVAVGRPEARMQFVDQSSILSPNSEGFWPLARKQRRAPESKPQKVAVHPRYGSRLATYHAGANVPSLKKFVESRKKLALVYEELFELGLQVGSQTDTFKRNSVSQENGSFSPSEGTAQLLSHLVRRAAIDASQFSNDLALEAASNQMTVGDMRNQLALAMGHAVTLFSTVSQKFGNSSVPLTDGSVFRPVFADYLLSELPVVPIVDARSLLSEVLSDLQASLRRGDVKAGQSMISFRGGQIFASATPQTRPIGLDLLDELESVRFG